ncbi:methyltransferase domain-containing protein [Brevibacillus massiliensis]|uniref:methyltransferase domain-containing protein n=1 Tax=Brevibacillus massiliensis TaxID=1118054 RepID=UPI00030523F8|nr:methyltransferase domain-containing protein [Brevibacillus massiliensis]
MLKSQICKQEDFETAWFRQACDKCKEPFRYHRKLWEFCYIYQGLLERGVLSPGKCGLGFGVGTEPLVPLFASHGCHITATDLDYDSALARGWVQTNQHFSSMAKINEKGICDPEQFQRLVRFQTLNMNSIGPEYHNQYDFTWSSCSFEHCGSIELGKQFTVNQMDCLKPGGIAIHTTEFNLSSNDGTLDSGPTVIFRLQDIEWMVQTLRQMGHSIDIDYSVGMSELESYVDVPPYLSDTHMRLQLGQYISTSIGLIIKKAE